MTCKNCSSSFGVFREYSDRIEYECECGHIYLGYSHILKTFKSKISKEVFDSDQNFFKVYNLFDKKDNFIGLKLVSEGHLYNGKLVKDEHITYEIRS